MTTDAQRQAWNSGTWVGYIQYCSMPLNENECGTKSIYAFIEDYCKGIYVSYCVRYLRPSGQLLRLLLSWLERLVHKGFIGAVYLGKNVVAGEILHALE